MSAVAPVIEHVVCLLHFRAHLRPCPFWLGRAPYWGCPLSLLCRSQARCLNLLSCPLAHLLQASRSGAPALQTRHVFYTGVVLTFRAAPRARLVTKEGSVKGLPWGVVFACASGSALCWVPPPLALISAAISVFYTLNVIAR